MRIHGKYIIALLCLIVSVNSAAQFKLYEKGHDSYTTGKYHDAIKYFSEYLTKYTRDKDLDVEVYYLRALSYYKTNEYKNAVANFEETILLNHTNKGNIYWFKAKCQEKNGAFADAISDYTNAIRELSFDKESKAKLLYERSLLYTQVGDLSHAYDDLKEGAVANPSNTDIKRELAKAEKEYLASRGATENIPAPTSKKKSTEKNDPSLKNTTITAETKIATSHKPNDSNTKVLVKQEKESAANGSAVVATSQPTLAEFYKDEKRYALVIGNSNYPKQIGVLKNPVNDATDVAKELENSNFDVQLLTNATYGQIRAALLKFKEKIDQGDRDKTVALFYFAGHGLQFEDENYIVPIDASVAYEDDIPRYCFPIQRMVLANMERSNARMNILILDACRNNPFPSVTRSAGQGLGEMRRARGSFIAYATAPGSVASDGSGKNGLYTQELLKAIKKPSLTIEQVFKEVRSNVLRLSGDKQNTWDSSNIIGEFYFKF